MKSKECKKKIERAIACAVFLALAWTVFLRCTYLFRGTQFNLRPQILGFYQEEPDSLDVIFVGPSSVHNYWNSMVAWHEYGITSYCYSNSAMTPDGMQYCLSDIRKTQNPVVAVVDVRRYLSRYSTADINDAAHRNLLDSLDFSLERLNAVNYVRKLNGVSVKDAVTEFVDLIYYHNNRSALANKLNWEMWDNRVEEYPYFGCFYKGSRILNGAIHQFFQKPEAISDEVSPLNDKDERALRDFLAYCRKNNLHVLLIASPYMFTEQDSQEFNAIAEIADEYDIPFLDVNRHLDEISFDYSTDFLNDAHTNIFGMEKYTRYVAGYLKEHYAIPDRRGEALATAWDELYVNYAEDVKSIKGRILAEIENKMQAIADEDIMRTTSDAGEWLSLANNSNMTIFVLMDQKSEFSPSLINEQLLKYYGLTTAVLTEKDHYFCVYSGKIVNSSESKLDCSGTFGFRDSKLNYSLNIGEQSEIKVEGQNYINGTQKGLYMAAFDNNTNEFVDSVYLTVSADGEIQIKHNSAA